MLELMEHGPDLLVQMDIAMNENRFAVDTTIAEYVAVELNSAVRIFTDEMQSDLAKAKQYTKNILYPNYERESWGIWCVCYRVVVHCFFDSFVAVATRCSPQFVY